MRAATDQDHGVLKRWYGMRDAETAVVWDAHIGGYPVCLLGLESQPMPRLGFVPADGPTSWTAGTLFPMSSKKVARAINGASNNRPVVFLAISRYHGGAFVVFSNKLNPSLEVSAREDTYASVIGGAPAAAVVFAGEVRKRTLSDSRIVELQLRLDQSVGADRVALRERLNKMRKVVHSERLREVAEEFDGIHSVDRALEVGSVQSKLKLPKRRTEWRLGRLAVKRLLAPDLGIERLGRIQIIAAEDGAPEAFVDGRRFEGSVSISHRSGVAACVVSQMARVWVVISKPSSRALSVSSTTSSPTASERKLRGPPDRSATAVWHSPGAPRKARSKSCGSVSGATRAT